MIISTKSRLFSLALVTLFTAACGQEKEKTVYVTQPPTNAPQTGAPQQQLPPITDPAQQADLLALEITNFEEINNKVIANGAPVHFKLKNSQTQITGIQFKCAIEAAGSTGTSVAQSCSSPHTIQVQQDGQYTLTIYASHSSSPTAGNPVQVSFAIGQGQLPPGQGGQPGIPGIGRPQREQVGDLFLVNIPQGMHKVYSSSTFDQPGFLKFRMVDASVRDNAAPYPLNCRQNANFEQLVPDTSPSGRVLDYCEITPPLAFNSPADPLFNAFRWMNMSTMSYNSLAIASDNSIGPQQPFGGSPVLSKMYINVFTNLTGAPTSQFLAPFTNELSQTVSRLQISCGAQTIQYLGNAATFQGYFSWSVAVTPLFGCVNPRGGKWYVDVAAFPIDQITPMVPSCGWSCWIGQNFANRRAAEIVAEIGPFDYAPVPMAVAPDAQAMMVQHIKRLTP